MEIIIEDLKELMKYLKLTLLQKELHIELVQEAYTKQTPQCSEHLYKNRT